jgi:hypothetical protein
MSVTELASGLRTFATDGYVSRAAHQIVLLSGNENASTKNYSEKRQ